MDKVTTVGIDLAKWVFALHGVTTEPTSRQSSRVELLPSNAAPKVAAADAIWQRYCNGFEQRIAAETELLM